MREQLSLFDLQQFTAPPVIKSVTDDSWDKPDSVTNTVLEQTKQSSKADSNVLEQATTNTNKSAPEQSHWVEKYTVIRYGKEHYYYRYLWMSGRKLHHRHIPGGSVKSQIAIGRKQQIERAIADGETPLAIEKLIRSWR
ncbi:hypothetical protein [Nostoc sp. TCL26-01]|uniref:hypothetical protein n=1 Tax=Nostoc sp. TCL26-01 TaxID=2576904 RepID=UPI0015BC7EEA|nr:hypothetical protein [Nostoc sp. TCL26-01]QLE55658.1 hypothetical protein FD725_09095 [Nostoc sp. TCL26-01]